MSPGSGAARKSLLIQFNADRAYNGRETAVRLEGVSSGSVANSCDEASLTPRLARLVAGLDDDLRQNLMERGVATCRDFAALGLDVAELSRELDVSPQHMMRFQKIHALATLQASSYDKERSEQRLDVLGDDGKVSTHRPRAEVHSKGFWHRSVHVWPICLGTGRVLLGQRSGGKDMDAHRWTCVCCRLAAGESSGETAALALASELSLETPQVDQINLVFTQRERREITQGLFAGQADNAFVDVYLALLIDEPNLEDLRLGRKDKQSAKFVTLEEFEAALQAKKDDFVHPSADYGKKLLQQMRMACQSFVEFEVARLRACLDGHAANIIQLFREIDKSGDGRIDIAEWRTVLGSLDINASKASIDVLFRKFDVEGSDTIEFAELKAWLAS